jgi:hypothetical protein
MRSPELVQSGFLHVEMSPRRVSFWFHSRRPFADSSAAPRMMKIAAGAA